MINLPFDFITVDEIENATGISQEKLKLEIINLTLVKEQMMLVVDIKLNFKLPIELEKKLKDGIKREIGKINFVKLNYIFEENSFGEDVPGSSVSFDGSDAGAKVNVAAKSETFENTKNISVKKGASRNLSSMKGDVHKKSEKAKKNSLGELIYGRKIKGNPVTFEEAIELSNSKENVTIQGKIFKITTSTIKSGKSILLIGITDGRRGFCVKQFLKPDEYVDVLEKISEGDYIKVCGQVRYDSFDHDNVLFFTSLEKTKKKAREDLHEGMKRVELHCHTFMSDNDGFNDVGELVETVAGWGQPAVAITDHGVVQAFPDAAKKAAKMAKAGKPVKIIYGMEGYLYPDEGAYDDSGNLDIKKNRTYHIILLAKNKTGLKNLYKLVSMSHIDYFYRRPRLPRSVIEEYREGLLVGSACEAGEVYTAVRTGKTDDELLQIASFYDYLEIQPLGNNQFMIDRDEYQNVHSRADLIDFNLKILELADRLGKPCVATTDSHYPDRNSSVFRSIVMEGHGFIDTESDDLILRTTDEMIEEFDYLGDRVEEVVIENTNKIADMCEVFEPVPDEKCPPHIDGAEEELEECCYSRAKEIYGDPLPDLIAERLDTELGSIIKNGYAVMYMAARLLVQKSLSDGYLVGSRGSIGSSFAATMAGITEVNPLPPHYVCPACKYTEFTDQPEKYDCGFDMPDKVCPECGTLMKKDGLNIPFATFLGFDGTKEPDIDLNFAGEYQSVAQKYVGEIFGEKNVYKAGTVSTIAEKTAYGYVKHYAEEHNLNLGVYDTEYLVKGCTGVKRTTGQHPGGIIVVPDDREIYEFCPIQKPANKRDTDVITTHFDYHKIENNLLKFDILGHDAPQELRHLQDMTGVDPMSIRFDDSKTLSLFTSLDALNIKNPNYKFTHATYAVPEFGTQFTRAMLDDVKPTTVSALIKISGFSHGTDVWQNNAENLIRNNIATIDEVISCRDDIMIYLQMKGVEDSDAFKIMEDVRKNRELTEKELDIMHSHGVPEWYIESCRTLKYLFPRAHAAAYVMMALRLAWFKVYYPPEFYAAWLTTKTDNFDINAALGGLEVTERSMDVLKSKGRDITAKQGEQITVYEVMYELFSRGYEFVSPRLGVSKADAFYVVDGKIVIPFNAVSGIGSQAAQSLTDAYEKAPFYSVDDVRTGTKLTNTNIDALRELNVFEGIPDSAQLSIFDL